MIKNDVRYYIAINYGNGKISYINEGTGNEFQKAWLGGIDYKKLTHTSRKEHALFFTHKQRANSFLTGILANNLMGFRASAFFLKTEQVKHNG